MCYDEATLQEIIDGVYTGDEQKVLRHLDQCEQCKSKFATLKSQETIIAKALNQGLDIPKPIPEQIINVNIPKRSGFKMNKIVKRFASVAVIAVVMASIIFIEPINAKAKELLQLFRMNEFETVTITDEDIREIDALFNKGNGQKEIEDFLKMDVTSKGEAKTETVISKTSDIKEVMLSAKILPLKEGSSYEYYSYDPEMDITVQLYVDKVNDFLHFIGEEARIPQNLDEKIFTIHTNETLSYRIKEENNNSEGLEGDRDKFIYVYQTMAPTLQLPEGVSEEDLMPILLSMSLIPDNIKNQLKNMENLSETAPIPVHAETQEVENITINGEKAIIIHNKDAVNSTYSLYFKQGEQLMSIRSNYPLEEILEMVKELN